MKSSSQTRFEVFAVLMLLLTLALAVGAQAALAADPSSGSSLATPPAGSEGRGGVDGGNAFVAASAATLAGTQGRGGASLSITAASSPAGTEGRGGVAGVQPATLAGELTVSENGFVSRARGGFPGGPAGVERTLVASSASSSSTAWIAAGILAALAFVAGFLALASSRRRAWQQRSSLASYCAYHPGDSLCGSA